MPCQPLSYCSKFSFPSMHVACDATPAPVPPYCKTWLYLFRVSTQLTLFTIRSGISSSADTVPLPALSSWGRTKCGGACGVAPAPTTSPRCPRCPCIARAPGSAPLDGASASSAGLPAASCSVTVVYVLALWKLFSPL